MKLHGGRGGGEPSRKPLTDGDRGDALGLDFQPQVPHHIYCPTLVIKARHDRTEIAMVTLHMRPVQGMLPRGVNVRQIERSWHVHA